MGRFARISNFIQSPSSSSYCSSSSEEEEQENKPFFLVNTSPKAPLSAFMASSNRNNSYNPMTNSNTNNTATSQTSTNTTQLLGLQQVGVSDRQQYQQHHQQMSYGMMMHTLTSSSSSTINPAAVAAPNFFTNCVCDELLWWSSNNNNNNRDGGSYDQLGEFDQELFYYLDGAHQADPSSSSPQEQKNTFALRPPTLNIFPSQPMYVDPSASSSTKSMSNTMERASTEASGSKRSSEPLMDFSDNKLTNSHLAPPPAASGSITAAVGGGSSAAGPSMSQPGKMVKIEGKAAGKAVASTSEQHDRPRTPPTDPKTLRRLAQNREAARKSRLRKKAYVQQLEASRLRLNQLEQEIQRARAQGYSVGGAAIVGAEQGLPLALGNMSSDAILFDIEYARWIEQQNHHISELRVAVDQRISENELRDYVDNCLSHFDELINLKCLLAKADVFHLISGSWKTPAEQCFLWIGGFRPSELIKMVLSNVEPLSDQQVMAICGIQRSSHEAEETLSQGLAALHQGLSNIILSESLNIPAAANMPSFMTQMAMAITKLSTIQGFVRQADSLRQQTFHRLHQNLTTRQAARSLLVIAEYFHRLRTLSSLWAARPRHD